MKLTERSYQYETSVGAFALKLKAGAQKVASGDIRGWEPEAIFSVPWGFETKTGSDLGLLLIFGWNGGQEDVSSLGANVTTTTFDFVKSKTEGWSLVEKVHVADTGSGSAVHFRIRLHSGPVVVFTLRPPPPFYTGGSIGNSSGTAECMIHLNSWDARKAHGLSWEEEKEAGTPPMPLLPLE